MISRPRRHAYHLLGVFRRPAQPTGPYGAWGLLPLVRRRRTVGFRVLGFRAIQRINKEDQGTTDLSDDHRAYGPT
eukprot:COSAG05_NODE_762_length_7482_cov_3.270486_4_plen_75_part_00